MKEGEVRKILEKCDALHEGHVVFTKKEVPPGSNNWEYFHGDKYVNKDEVFWLPTCLWKLSNEIAHRLVGKKIDVIVGPEKGAIGLAAILAIQLTSLQELSLLPSQGEVSTCFSEKVGEEEMVIKRIFSDHIKDNLGCNVWIAEDISNSGSSIRKSVRAARKLGANVIGASVLATRRVLTLDDTDGVPTQWLTLVEGNMWPEDECPLCKRDGIKSVSLSVGKGEDFLRRKGVLTFFNDEKHEKENE